MAEENKPVENLDEDESLDANSLTIQNEKDDSTDEDNTIPNSDEIKKIKENFDKTKKKSTLNKILFSLIGFLLFLLLAGAILFFLGFFDPQEPTQNKTVQENILEPEKKEENYTFDIKDINSKKLNEQLSYLTNKNIPQDKNEELERIENEKRLIEEQKIKEAELLKSQEEELLKEKNAIEEKKIQLENEKIQLEAMRQEALLLKEELEANKVQLETNVSQEIPKDDLKVNEENTVADNKIEQKTDDSFLKLINVAKIKGSLYKKYLDSITSINTNVILCRDDKNRIEIYFGPFNNNETRSDLLNKLIKEGFEEAYELELTQEEFDKRCNY